MAELADAPDSKSGEGNLVGVQVPPSVEFPPAKILEQWGIGHWKMDNSHIAVYFLFSNFRIIFLISF